MSVGRIRYSTSVYGPLHVRKPYIHDHRSAAAARKKAISYLQFHQHAPACAAVGAMCL
jgi:hypothetical protein